MKSCDKTGLLPMSLPEASRARISPLPEDKQESKEKDRDSGRNSAVLLATYDRNTPSSKTFETFYQEGQKSSGRLTDAYAAGLIDGEGCLYLQHNKKVNTFTPRCDVGMTVKGDLVLKKMKKQYGGKIRQTRKATNQWERAICWTLMGKECASFLSAISPHLVLKSEQARILLQLNDFLQSLPKHPNGTVQWSNDARRQGAIAKSLISELNQKGPTVTRQAGWFARHVEGMWLTPQTDLVSPSGLTEFSETWPRSGMTRNGIAYLLPPLVPRIDANEFGSWPTPRNCMAMAANFTEKAIMKSHSRFPNLETVVQQKMWPTPQASQRGDCPSERRRNTPGLMSAVKMWPTPQSSDNRDRGNLSSGAVKRRMEKGKQISLSQSVSHDNGALNPTWVEWLMGFPLGWTDLEV